MSTPTQVVQQAYAAFGRGDAEGTRGAPWENDVMHGGCSLGGARLGSSDVSAVKGR
jgi:hypothetical protein